MDNKYLEQIKIWFIRIWKFDDRISFEVFLSAFFACISIYVTLHISGSEANRIAMYYFLLASIIFIVFAILTLTKIKLARNNSTKNKLDDILKSIKEYKQLKNELDDFFKQLKDNNDNDKI